MSDLLTMARNLRPYIEQAAQNLPDADGLKAKALYPPLGDSCEEGQCGGGGGLSLYLQRSLV